MEAMAVMLQEIMRKLESFDSRPGVIEENSQTKTSKEEGTGEEGGGLEGRMIRRNEGYGERVTRHTKLEFPSIDGNKVQECLFKCERFFEIDETPADMKVSIASIHLSSLAME